MSAHATSNFSLEYMYIQGVPQKSIFKGHRVELALGADLLHLFRGLLKFDAVLSQICTTWHSLTCVYSLMTNLNEKLNKTK